jgi:glycosyltransferase involved in cell wall biosynthesis
MRVHLLAVPNTQTTAAYPLDGFCVRTRYFARLLLRLGHEVILYGVGENDTPCSAFVSCLTTEEQRGFVGATPYQAVPFDGNSPLFRAFNARAAQHLRAVKAPQDVIATIAGGAQGAVWEENAELALLEYSIGYTGLCVCAPFRVFQSHVWRHHMHGMNGIPTGRVSDTVIPPWFDADAVPYRETAEDYVVFCGRLTAVKGIKTACDAAQRAGVRLVVMGHGDRSLVTYGDYLGAVSTEERDRVYAGARAVLAPTQYLEPFGNIAAEAQLCGTPMITTDFGAFVESVEQGVTGFRCATLGEFVQAIDLARGLDRATVRARAVRLYGEDAAALAYQKYFARLTALRQGDGLAPTLPFQFAETVQ